MAALAPLPAEQHRLYLVPPLERNAPEVVEEGESALARYDYAAADEALKALPHGFWHVSPAELRARALRVVSSAALNLGDLDAAERAAQSLRATVETAAFDDLARADALFHLGCSRHLRGRTANAIGLLSAALRLCERDETGNDALRVSILDWRSRSYRRQRDWESASADAEAAFELADTLDDDRSAGSAALQASTLAERRGQTLVARFFAEQACERFTAAGDRVSLGRALNNLGGIDALLGDTAGALESIDAAIAVLTEAGQDGDAAQANSSRAQILLLCEDAAQAEPEARAAMAVLDGLATHALESGTVRVTLGTALAALGRPDEAEAVLREAEDRFQALELPSHTARAVAARADVVAERGDCGAALGLYREALALVQDVRF
ncbi:MAG TPA: tetratricopeptide repeat protein [Gaiellaceae bacterium]|jgi:tetratricopeptide (TPR) repeat protein|nr:tetratricopeptide repeat protein [Gaiellaceae bacterium]